MKISKTEKEWLDNYTKEEIRYIRTPKNYAKEITCWVFCHKLGHDTLLFSAVGKVIRVTVTDGTVDIVREEFSNWRDAINFARGVIVVRQEFFPNSAWELMRKHAKETLVKEHKNA